MSRAALALLAATLASPAAAESAVGVDLFSSSDSDHTDVLKVGINLDWHWDGPDQRQGIRIERAWFRPVGRRGRSFDRAYVRLADTLGKWKWNATAGTDGHTLLGSAAIHNDAKYRQEYFVEREIIETPVGLTRRVYYTFGGAAIDLPAGESDNVTLFAGLQKFSGDNLRTHLRVSYVQVVEPEWGLSIQLRTRAFRSSHPHEFDYYSPRWYAEVLPVLQVRRFVRGWQLLGAAGFGAQRDSDRRWRSSRYLNARVNSPAFQKGWAFNAAATYSNTPVASGLVYRYTQFTLGLTKAL